METPPTLSTTDTPPQTVLEAPISILIVDDEPKNLTVLETILDDPGYRIVRAETANQALLALVLEEFALLILDIRMPDMSGFELAQTIKARKKTARVPIIFLTAYYNEDQHVLEGYDMGAVDYLHKPVSGPILRSKVAVFAELHRKQRESAIANAALVVEVADHRQAQEQLRELNRTLEEQKKQLEHQTVRLRNLATELTRVEQRERKRLAALLHDNLQQSLVAANMGLSAARESASKRSGAEKLDLARAMIEEAIRTSRDLTRELRPPALYEGGLGAALQWLASKNERMYKLPTNIVGAHLGRSLDPDVKGLLFACVGELYLNTVKHAEARNIRMKLREEDSRLYLSFEDDGKGFEASPEEECGAEGFGLFSIRERLAAFGGSMRIRSRAGAGTRVELQVPMQLDLPNDENGDPIRVEMDKPGVDYELSDPCDGGPCRVLIADDHPIVRTGIANLLAGDNRLCVIGQVGDGIEAIAAVERERPHVVLLDVNMPRMNGIDSAREIHRRWPSVTIIGLSVQDDEATARTMLEAGATAFVAKSSDPAGILSTIVELAQVSKDKGNQHDSSRNGGGRGFSPEG